LRKIQQLESPVVPIFAEIRRGAGAHLLRFVKTGMSLLRFLESWTEGVVRIFIGFGLCWIGSVEGAGDGLFLRVVGVIFLAAGIGEIWAVEAAMWRQKRTG